jgi:uncharacterized protein YbaP (TraB family)
MRLSFIALILSFTVAGAQNSPLWEITGNGLSSPSYLYGSLKFTHEEKLHIPTIVTEKIKSSKVFAIEDQVDHHAQHELNEALHFPKGESLATHLTVDEYNKVLGFFEREFKLSKSAFESKYGKMKPLALSIAMTRMSLGNKVKFYDIELLNIAVHNKVKTYSLEPIEREAQVLNAYPLANQTHALITSIDQFEEQKASFQKLMAAYPLGTLDEIFNYSLHPTEDNPAFIEEFYYKRNEEWLPAIQKMMKENPSFICVGVTHLEGDRGLLALLKSKGYTLTSIALKK